VYPFETFISKTESKLPKDSKIKANQIRTIDKNRLIKCMSRLSEEKLQEVERAILIHLGIKG
jgi:mRNA interferase MazF